MSIAEDLLDDLDARGLIQETTDRAALAARLAEGPVGVYLGFDPTADSLHTGNLLGLLVLRRFQEAGHRVVALAGGATGMVGDPSGRSDERNLLDAATLDANTAAIKAEISRFVHVEGERGLLVDNRDWTVDVPVLTFLRDVGKHVTVNQMLARESVKARLASENGISFTEFSYMLLQAHDFLRLQESHGVELQIGGSDQWGNILSGVDLIRRVRGEAAHGLSWPLLTAPDGTKLGKTTGARIWLSPARTSPYRFFQHWMQTDDRQVREYLAKFTLLPVPEVDEIAAVHTADPGRRSGQRRLAREVTRLVHGAEAATAAEAASTVLFGGPVEGAGADALALVAEEVPSAELPAAALNGAGADLVELLVASGLATSKGDARRGLGEGAVYINGSRASLEISVTSADLLHGRYVVLRRGKKRYALLVREGFPRNSGNSPQEG